MQIETTDSFVGSVKPLFKKRTIYRILTASVFLPSIISYDSWFFIPCIIVLFVVSFTLVTTDIALERKVWERFSKQLDSHQATRSAISLTNLKGVIGSIGDSRYLSTLAAGTYGPYNVQLLKQTVTYRPDSRNGSYSRGYRILEITTHQDFYHVFIDSKSNNQRWLSKAMNILSLSIRSNQTLDVEGDVHKYFKIYVPANDQYKSLVTLSPEKLLALRDYGTNFDVEFIDNKIYVITNDKIKNVKDILLYQESVLKLLENIGTDIVRTRHDVDSSLTVKTPTVLSF